MTRKNYKKKLRRNSGGWVPTEFLPIAFVIFLGTPNRNQIGNKKGNLFIEDAQIKKGRGGLIPVPPIPREVAFDRDNFTSGFVFIRSTDSLRLSPNAVLRLLVKQTLKLCERIVVV